MLRLYVLRHAKTSWALPGQTDFQRQLNERGIEDAVLTQRADAPGAKGRVPGRRAVVGERGAREHKWMGERDRSSAGHGKGGGAQREGLGH